MAKTVLGARNSGPTIARYDITVAVTCLLRPPQPENVSAPYYVMAFHTEQQHRKKKRKIMDFTFRYFHTALVWKLMLEQTN